MTTEQGLAVDGAIVQGKLIDALKLYRQATGVPLGPAKAYVDERRRSLLLLAPTPSRKPSDLAGWSLVSYLSLGFVAFGSLYLVVTLAR